MTNEEEDRLALQISAERQYASVSLFQRGLGWGYIRARATYERLSAAGELKNYPSTRPVTQEPSQ